MNYGGRGHFTPPPNVFDLGEAGGGWAVCTLCGSDLWQPVRAIFARDLPRCRLTIIVLRKHPCE